MTREEWLTAAINELRPWFQLSGLKLSQRIRVTCGFPSTARRTGAVSECWASEASADGTIEVLISPTLADPVAVFTVLLTTLCHATDGAMSAKSDAYINALRLMGVPGGVPGEAFGVQYDEIIQGLGDYPHAALTLNERPKQTTRMLKAYCTECGYTVRVTDKWASRAALTCKGYIDKTGPVPVSHEHPSVFLALETKQ